jgi:acyl-CoA ligase (AMP-forming) (exosortase A-associated)
MLGEQPPPVEPIKRRALHFGGEQPCQYGIGLHFLKIVVIIDVHHSKPPSELHFMSAQSPIRPLDHLAECGEAEAPALVLRDGPVNYETLRSRVAVLAGWLERQVPDKGARVASWAAKGELTCLMPLATARAGLVHVPVNPLLKRAQVAHILADSGAALLIGTPARLRTLEPGDAQCVVVEEAAALDAARALALALPPSSGDADALAAILYTSGSTGRPKGVMLSHANMWLGAESVAQYLGLAADDRTLAVLPLSFDYGQNQLLSTWFAGGCVIPLDYLVPRDVIKAVEKHGVTTLAAVPPLWVQLTELDWPVETAARLRRLTNSGGALTVDLVRRLRALFPRARLFPMYGLTEAFRSTYLDPALVDAHPASMGRAIPHAEILVIDEAGEVAADSEEGELVHCGPLVAKGYWQDAERTAERFRPAPAASRYGGMAVWSGDRVRRDADGLLYFVGRRDAMIKSAGNRISPQEIEEAALASGLVAEAVALGVPDARLGQAVHLIVRPSAGATDARDALPRRLAQDLPNFMQPRAIHWREAMPIGPNGKIDRNGLSLELAAQLAAELAA